MGDCKSLWKGVFSVNKMFSPFPVCILLCIAGIGFSFSSYAETTNTIFLSLLLMLLVLFIHELGHVMGGELAGYEFVYMTVGPFTIEKSPKLKVVGNDNWLTFGGLASCVPIKAELKGLVKRHQFFVAGGPVMTFFAFMVGLIVWLLTDHPFALLFMMLNAAIFFATAIPFQGTFKSDGAVFLFLRKGGKEAETFLAELLLLKEMMSPKNPAEWDEKLLVEVRGSEATVAQGMIACFLFYYDLFTADFVTASRGVESFKQIPINNKNKITLQLITHIRQIDELFSGKPDIQLIKDLQKSMSKMEPISYTRSEAILTYLQNEPEKAFQLLDEVLDRCEKGVERYGFFEAEHKLTQLIIQYLSKQGDGSFAS
jgi:hypothetical protein